MEMNERVIIVCPQKQLCAAALPPTNHTANDTVSQAHNSGDTPIHQHCSENLYNPASARVNGTNGHATTKPLTKAHMNMGISCTRHLGSALCTACHCPHLSPCHYQQTTRMVTGMPGLGHNISTPQTNLHHSTLHPPKVPCPTLTCLQLPLSEQLGLMWARAMQKPHCRTHDMPTQPPVVISQIS